MANGNNNHELEKTLWAADKMRSNMDAAEYKHVYEFAQRENCFD